MPDNEDNWMEQPNGTEYDTDRNGLGDACDADDTGDSLHDDLDPCPRLAGNSDDLDGDGLGDGCDDDDDIPDLDDLCPAFADPSQLDSDHDGQSDACDICPFDAAAAHVDTDGDGFRQRLRTRRRLRSGRDEPLSVHLDRQSGGQPLRRPW